jgi:hypothetical protein
VQRKSRRITSDTVGRINIYTKRGIGAGFAHRKVMICRRPRHIALLSSSHIIFVSHGSEQIVITHVRCVHAVIKAKPTADMCAP